MKILLFGASGMVGRGVLRECLLDPRVERVLSVGRAATGVDDAKLVERVVPDLFDLSAIDAELSDFDACFFCLGVSAAGMSAEQYRRITHDLTIFVAKTLLPKNPKMTFVYVSGDGTNAKSGTMWSRVKGETENELLALGFARAFMFRPALIQPMHGVVSHTKAYRIPLRLDVAALPRPRPSLRDDVGAGRTGDARRGEDGRGVAHRGESGHQRAGARNQRVNG